MAEKYQKLFSEFRIGKVLLRNRIVMSPAETLYASACGEVTPQIIEFYRRRAKGGVGMIVLHSVQGNSKYDPLDPYAGSLRLDNNAYIPMMSDLVEAVHNEGAKIACLVSIGGGAKGAGEEYADGLAKDKRRVAPSAIDAHDGQPECREFSTSEIKQMVEGFGRCAWRAKAAGFDFFYIHALGSYLLAEFLSPLFNHRTDEYGGSAENRWRILFELIESCKRQAGADFPIVVRISVDEMHNDGRTLEETLHFLPRLEKAGVAALDVTAGLMDPFHRSLPPIYVEPGINRPYLEAVRKVVSIPMINSGHLNELDLAEKFISENVIDLVSIARGLIADPDLPIKAQLGKEYSIRKCLKCNYCIGHRIMQRLPIRCAFNPYAGHESTESEEVAKTESPKRFAVVGGGPAGLEIVRMLALKGHSIDLFEKESQICGGQMAVACLPPCKKNLRNVRSYYNAALSEFENVSIHLESEVSADDFRQGEFEKVFIATGASPIVPRIPGIDLNNVNLAEDVLVGNVMAGKRVVVLGGGQIGAETAHFLSERGHEVTIIDQLPGIAVQEEPLSRGALLSILGKNGVTMLTSKRIEEIADGAVIISDLGTGLRESIPFDSAVIAFGTKPDNSLYSELKEKGIDVQLVGDSKKVGNIATAIADAHYIAKSI